MERVSQKKVVQICVHKRTFKELKKLVQFLSQFCARSSTGLEHLIFIELVDVGDTLSRFFLKVFVEFLPKIWCDSDFLHF